MLFLNEREWKGHVLCDRVYKIEGNDGFGGQRCIRAFVIDGLALSFKGNILSSGFIEKAASHPRTGSIYPQTLIRFEIIIAKESGTGENEFSFTIKQNLKSHTRVRYFNTVWLIKLCWLGLGGRWTLASQLIMWNCSLEAIWVLYRPHEALKLVFILERTVNHDANWKERIFWL